MFQYLKTGTFILSTVPFHVFKSTISMHHIWSEIHWLLFNLLSNWRLLNIQLMLRAISTQYANGCQIVNSNDLAQCIRVVLGKAHLLNKVLNFISDFLWDRSQYSHIMDTLCSNNLKRDNSLQDV